MDKEKITHEWLIGNGFQSHKSSKIVLYTRDNHGYIHNDGEDFSLRIKNCITHKPIKYIIDFVSLHKLISGVEIINVTNINVADLNHVVINSVMNISGTSYNNKDENYSLIQKECENIISFVKEL